MAGTPETTHPVVGLSGSVLEPAFSGGRLDGIGVYTQALEQGLRGLGVATRRVGAPRFRGGRFVAPAHSDLDFRWPPGWTLAATAALPVATPGSRAVAAAIDLYHATDYLVPRLRRTPVVATLYDAIPFARPDWANARLRRGKNALLRRAAGNADLVLAISEAAVAEIVEHYRVPRERIRVVPLGVDDDFFDAAAAPDLDARLAAQGLPRGAVLFVGTLQPRKNLATLLAAWDRLPAQLRNAHPLIVAGKYGWGADDLRADLEKRRASGGVRWLDYVERELLLALYASARVFAFPSLGEGFGLPVLEALAAGTAVVASDLPVLREVAGDTATYVTPSDADALAGALQRTLEAPDDAAAREARRAHARRFDWASCARGTLAAYRELLGDPAR